MVPIIAIPIEQIVHWEGHLASVPKCLKLPVYLLRTFVWFLPASLLNILELTYVLFLGGGTSIEESEVMLIKQIFEAPLQIVIYIPYVMFLGIYADQDQKPDE